MQLKTIKRQIYGRGSYNLIENIVLAK